MQSLKNFLSALKQKALDSGFRQNFQKLVSQIPDSLDEFDLLMGLMAKLGPKAQETWFRFFEKMPVNAKQRVENLIKFSKQKACFK
jgi:hypothetical protein